MTENELLAERIKSATKIVELGCGDKLPGIPIAHDLWHAAVKFLRMEYSRADYFPSRLSGEKS